MPLQALGALTVTTPGTKVAVASLIPAAQFPPNQGPFKGHGIMFQARENNTDHVRVYQLQSATYILLAVLAPPTANFIPSFSAAFTLAMNSINFSDLFLDADVGGEGALVTVLIG